MNKSFNFDNYKKIVASKRDRERDVNKKVVKKILKLNIEINIHTLAKESN